MKTIALIISSLFIFTCALAENPDTGFTATKVIDLTHPLHEGVPYYPGGVPFRMEQLADYKQDGYRLHKFTMGENTGTHVDAPAHFIEGNRSIDEIPLNRLVAPIVLIDARAQSRAHSDYRLSVRDIEDWEAGNGQIPTGSLVVMNTGWYEKFHSMAQYVNMDKDNVMHFPGYSPEAARVLLQRDVAGIGIDTLSLDYGKSTDFPVHVLMLKANKYQIENMANLDALPEKGATAVIGVLPVQGGSQAQARILAFLP
uniref:Kynurenine formamidase n=1 Tax=Candidatus Kentrum eta TaxID=2126337 RepID=A0A450V910_9GAMM|nr:MAG: Kynurenine formamidase [Candidatus Kentron sp. H]VFJ94677.1 MAG: Kynurenine formamidase [Candidatus Kentron sp. H]VFK01197.1 MAG: Kynurenine formamidase [Candidatus Kentron sp. H]